MPSPSRIPRCKVPKAFSKEVQENQKLLQGKNSKLTYLYKPTIKSSQTIVTGRNGDSSTKPVADRRGITEVKRCEKALKSKVEALEKELADIKNKLQTDQQPVEKLKTKNHFLIKEESQFEEELMQLEQSNKSLFDQLVSLDFDPVSNEYVKMSEEGMLSFQNSSACAEKECAQMLLSLSVFENTCNVIIDKLNT